LAFNDAVGSMYLNEGCVTDFWHLTGEGPDVWYVFESDGGCYSVSLCGSAYDTSLGLFSVDDQQLGENEDWCGSNSAINECFLPAGLVYIAVDGYNGEMGYYILCVTDCDPPTADIVDHPQSFELKGAHPNPFNPTTTIDFTIP
jgi:hypothetical protein